MRCGCCSHQTRGMSSCHAHSAEHTFIMLCEGEEKWTRALFWGDEVAVTNFLNPRSSGCSAFRISSHMATGSLPLLRVLSLSPKAMLSSKRKTRPSPEPEGKTLTDSKCSGDCGDPGSSGCGGQALWERNEMKLQPAWPINLTTLGKTSIPA